MAAAKIVVDDANADLWEQLELLQEQLESVKLTNSCLSQLAQRAEVERQRAKAVAAQIMPLSVQNSSSSRRSAEDEFGGETHSCKRNRHRSCGEDSGDTCSTEYVDDVDEPIYRGPIEMPGQRAAPGERRPVVTVLPATDDVDDADLEFHETSIDSELSEGGVTYRSCSGRPDEEELAAAAEAGLDVVAPQKVSVDQLREINAALRALTANGANATATTADLEVQFDRLRLLLSAS